jgi:hypothetical protein
MARSRTARKPTTRTSRIAYTALPLLHEQLSRSTNDAIVGAVLVPAQRRHEPQMISCRGVCPLVELNFQQIRPYSQGQREAFEELCCQIFRRAPEVPSGAAVYRRFRGAGGDGGVEAIWRYSDGRVWGLQSKFFRSLGNSEKEQMRRSLQQASENYPHLSRYTFALPVQLTGPGAGGKSRKSQTEKLEGWTAEWRVAAAARGVSLEIDWWDATELGDRLQEMDPSGGRVRYWFDAKILSQDWFAKHLDDATAQAGARYSPQLSVDVPAFGALEALGRTDPWSRSVKEKASELETSPDHS